MDGVLNVRKTSGPTSHDIVYDIRRIFGQKRVGHAGTLDPMATGVLVVCLGKATRIVEYLMGAPKEYIAEMILGQSTDSEDSTGNITSEKDASFLTLEALKEAAQSFTGEIMQTPPMVSAVKHNGERLYKLARQGQVVERQPRKVTVYVVEVLGFTPGKLAKAKIRIECSSGTYIRTLCSDIGDKLGCGAHMAALERTRVGRFTIENAYTVNNIREAKDQNRLDSLVINIGDALSDMPCVEVSDLEADQIKNGRSVAVQYSGDAGDTVRSVSKSGDLVAIGSIMASDENMIFKPDKVLASE
jgi:tRNA pseudouridine55 synthase